MTGSWDALLRDELLRATTADLARRRRFRRWLAAAVAAVVAAVASFLTVLSPSPAAADVVVEVRGNVVEVRVTDLDSTPDDVREAFEKAGLDVEVDGVPVGPSLVGRFVAVGFDADPSAPPVKRIDERAGGFLGFEVPKGWPGTMTISLGQPAAPRDLYFQGSDAFAEGEPLRCVEVRGRTLADAADLLDDFDVTVQRVGVLGVPQSLDGALGSPLADHVVMAAQALSASHVVLQVAAPPTAAPGPQKC